MRTYSVERKEAILSKILPPLSRSIGEVAREEDIPYSTLYTWLKSVQKNGVGMSRKAKLTAEKKLAVIIETGTLTESELSAYCRKNGFYPEQVKAWKEEFVQGVENKSRTISTKESQADKKEIKALKKELRRKEKALAETAALLVLRKKLNALYGQDDEES